MVQEAFYIASLRTVEDGYNILKVDLDGDQLTSYFKLWFQSEEGQKSFQATLKSRKKLTKEEMSKNMLTWLSTEEGKRHLEKRSKELQEYCKTEKGFEDMSTRRRNFLNSEEGEKWKKEHSAKLTGRTQSEEANKKRSDTCLARGDMSHPHSQETKDLLSKLALARPKGRKWWYDGKEEALALQSPGESWKLGRLRS